MRRLRYWSQRSLLLLSLSLIVGGGVLLMFILSVKPEGKKAQIVTERTRSSTVTIGKGKGPPISAVIGKKEMEGEPLGGSILEEGPAVSKPTDSSAVIRENRIVEKALITGRDVGDKRAPAEESADQGTAFGQQAMVSDIGTKRVPHHEPAVESRLESEEEEEIQAEIAGKINISGIITHGDEALAIVNGKVVREGDKIGGIKILEITVDEITVSYRGEFWAIQLAW